MPEEEGEDGSRSSREDRGCRGLPGESRRKTLLAPPFSNGQREQAQAVEEEEGWLRIAEGCEGRESEGRRDGLKDPPLPDRGMRVHVGEPDLVAVACVSAKVGDHP